MEMAECIHCGQNKQVCCDSGFIVEDNNTITHIDPVCVDCCKHSPQRQAGIGGLERADCD
jgi:hypothetical protein